MKTLLIFTAFLMFLPYHLSAQQKPAYVGEWYRGKAAGKTPEQARDFFNRATSDFPRTKRYNLRANVNQLNSILRTAPELLDLVVPYGDRIYTLNLSRVNIIAPGFSVNSDRGRSNHNTGVQYRGIVDGNPNHIASLSLTPGDIQGYFSTGEGNFVITKEGLEFIVYNQNDMPVPAGIICSTPETTTQVPVTAELVTGVGCKTVNVYFECDYSFFQAKGSNLTTSTDYVIGFFNQVATLYANENVAVQISEIFTWTSPDPYMGYTSNSDILNAFRTTRGTSFNGHIAHFLTTRNVGGGVGYVDALCNKAYAYAVSMVYSTYNNFPTYSWTVEVVTHEMGHNLGSPHTHSCSWSIGPLDNCYTPEGGCAAGPAPSNGGTIMSYCHLTSYGINFTNGFGYYPGNLIRSRVLNATCIAGGGSSYPASLSTSNISANAATLNWSAVTGANTYSVQYRLSSSATWISLGSTNSTSMNLTGLNAGSSYVWTVKSDCSDYAPAISFTTTSGNTGCASPTGLVSSSVTESAAVLSWVAVAGANNYTVQYRLSSSSSWNSATVNNTSVSLTGLSAGSNYVWQVKADCSSYSAAVSFTTNSAPPPPSGNCAVATGLGERNISSGSATLFWTGAANAQSYTVQFREAGKNWSNYSTTGNSIGVRLRPHRSYEWRVDTRCSDGSVSGYSISRSFSN